MLVYPLSESTWNTVPVCVYMCVCVCASVCECVSVCVSVCVCIYICVYVCVCTIADNRALARTPLSTIHNKRTGIDRKQAACSSGRHAGPLTPHTSLVRVRCQHVREAYWVVHSCDRGLVLLFYQAGVRRGVRCEV